MNFIGIKTLIPLISSCSGSNALLDSYKTKYQKLFCEINGFSHLIDDVLEQYFL